MVLSACVLEDERKRMGRDEKTAQGGQEVCWLVEEAVPQWDYIFCHLDRSLRRIPLLDRDSQMTTTSNASETTPLTCPGS